VFSLKLIARPDPRMVDVPLDLEAELPREFDGAAVLSASGLPRKVRLKAQRDLLKLSTAYRADQLVAEIARTVLRASPEDVERAQAAARAFLRTVRERRQEGATLLVEANGDGRLEVSETAPPKDREAPRPAQKEAISPARRLAHLEARVAYLEKRLADLEARPFPPAAEGSEARRVALRRATALDAFADGLRSELRERVGTHLEAAARAAARLDRASTPDDAQDAATARELRAAGAEASAREHALRRVYEEIDLYPASDLPLVERLVERLVAAMPPPPPELDQRPAAPLPSPQPDAPGGRGTPESLSSTPDAPGPGHRGASHPAAEPPSSSPGLANRSAPQLAAEPAPSPLDAPGRGHGGASQPAAEPASSSPDAPPPARSAGGIPP
jgi:hypothetical protein